MASIKLKFEFESMPVEPTPPTWWGSGFVVLRENLVWGRFFKSEPTWGLARLDDGRVVFTPWHPRERLFAGDRVAFKEGDIERGPKGLRCSLFLTAAQAQTMPTRAEFEAWQAAREAHKAALAAWQAAREAAIRARIEELRAEYNARSIAFYTDASGAGGEFIVAFDTPEELAKRAREEALQRAQREGWALLEQLHADNARWSASDECAGYRVNSDVVVDRLYANEFGVMWVDTSVGVGGLAWEDVEAIEECIVNDSWGVNPWGDGGDDVHVARRVEWREIYRKHSKLEE